MPTAKFYNSAKEYRKKASKLKKEKEQEMIKFSLLSAANIGMAMLEAKNTKTLGRFKGGIIKEWKELHKLFGIKDPYYR